VEGGALRGDLILVAAGDLTLGGRTLPDGAMAFVDNDHTYADATSTTANITPTDPLAGLKDLARQVKAVANHPRQGEALIDPRPYRLPRRAGRPRLLRGRPGRVRPGAVHRNGATGRRRSAGQPAARAAGAAAGARRVRPADARGAVHLAALIGGDQGDAQG